MQSLFIQCNVQNHLFAAYLTSRLFKKAPYGEGCWLETFVPKRKTYSCGLAPG